MRKSQQKPVPEDPQEQKEQHQTSDGGASCTEVHDETVPSREFQGEQERPARTVGDLRKIYEPQETKRPQRKNDDRGKTFEVRDQDGTGYKSHVLHLGVDQNRNVPNQEPQERSELQERNEKTPVKLEDPQEKNEDQGRPAMTVGDLLKIYEPQKTNRPETESDDHGKTFGTEYKPPELHSGVDPKRNVPNQGTEYKPPELHSGVDPKRNVPNQGFLGNEFGTGYKSHVLHSDVDQKRNVSNQVFFGNEIEKTPVKSVKGEQDTDDLQKKIARLGPPGESPAGSLCRGRLHHARFRSTRTRWRNTTRACPSPPCRHARRAQRRARCPPPAACRGDLLKKIDKGENDKHDLHKHIGGLLRKLDKGEQERDDLLRKLEKTPKKDDDFQKTFDKGEQDKDKIKQEKDKIAQEKDISQDNLEELLNAAEELLNAAEQLQKEIEKEEAQFKSDWRKEEFQTVNLTLDAATAHPALFLSEEGRRVTWQEPRQDLPSCSQRFTSLTCVLGQLHVSSKRYFWEVEVGDAHSWDLGVCRDNVTRNGRVKMSPQNGFWAIRLYEGEYWGLTSPETYLTLKEKPCRLGVFLDYEAGDVSFYNMADGSHIFTFSEQAFYGVLRPLFRLQASDSGSLTIVQVE